jgi:hypothetical protein
LALRGDSKEVLDEGNLSQDVTLASHLTCPLRIMFMASYPAMVRAAVAPGPNQTGSDAFFNEPVV